MQQKNVKRRLSAFRALTVKEERESLPGPVLCQGNYCQESRFKAAASSFMQRATSQYSLEESREPPPQSPRRKAPVTQRVTDANLNQPQWKSVGILTLLWVYCVGRRDECGGTLPDDTATHAESLSSPLATMPRLSLPRYALRPAEHCLTPQLYMPSLDPVYITLSKHVQP